MGRTEIERRGSWFASPTATPAADEVVIRDRRRSIWRGLASLVTVVNFLGPAAAGCWLALGGHRIEAGAGIGLALAMPFVWGWLASWPASIIAPSDMSRSAVLVVVRGFLAAGWQYCVIAAWTFGVFLFFEGRMHPGNTPAMIVWAYGTVMGPLSYMASKDPALDSAPVLALAVAFVAYWTVVDFWSGGDSVHAAGYGLLGLVGAASAVNATFAGRAARRNKSAASVSRSAVQVSDLGRDLHEALKQTE